MTTHEDVTKMLKKEMTPALGARAHRLCAGRGALQAASDGGAEADEDICHPAFLKIGFGVATPGTSEPGIGIAAAIGLLGGDYTLGFRCSKRRRRRILKTRTAWYKTERSRY
jgi:L-cysteine desulfidase